MNEQQWLEEKDPGKLLTALRSAPLHNRVSSRKLRLFACACARKVWHLLTDEDSRNAVEAAERLADGLLTRKELAASPTRLRASFAAKGSDAATAARKTLMKSASMAAMDAYSSARRVLCLQHPALQGGAWRAVLTRYDRELILLLRDILNNPFAEAGARSGGLARNADTVRTMAEAIYQERSFADCPILADALEEAGCEDAEVLGHLRGPGPHARGCWVIDLLTSRV
jgi:hypothetical protein